jgi:type II secretory pathway pseudopilin PulG
MKTKQRKVGFSIVELLTVMSVIAMLMGILVPALNLVRKLAKDVNQRAEFYSINAALETYVNESPTQQYPESSHLGSVVVNGVTVGAQRLTEALLGRDLVGLDPNTTWDAFADKDQAGNQAAYASLNPPKNSTQAQVNDSLARRQGPYLNPTNAEVFQVGQLYDATHRGFVYDGVTVASPAPVLTDIYRVKNVVSQGKTIMAGTPILYYKADTTTTHFPDVSVLTTIDDANVSKSIYDSNDNEELITLGTVKNPSTLHNFDFLHNTVKPDGTHDGRWWFYKTITDRKITSQARPYNMTSYILISAGADGIYGTKDDIYNFQ